MNKQNLKLSPELPIGTELWYMHKNRPALALVAAINIRVTSCIDSNRSWREQIFSRWLNKTAKTEWEYSYDYELKMDDFIEMFTLNKGKDGWYISNRKCFFSKQELIKSFETN